MSQVCLKFSAWVERRSAHLKDGTLMVLGNRALIGAALLATVLGIGARAQSQAPMSTQDREQYREKLLQIVPPDPTFDAWLKKTNALPPDFNSLPRHNSLPDPLAFLNGRSVATAAQWPARREEISNLSQKYVWGTVPPRPKIDHVVVLDERHEDGYTVRNRSEERRVGKECRSRWSPYH